MLSVRQAWRDGDPPPLPAADSQQSLVHARNHIPHPDVSVVRAIPLVAVERNRHKTGSFVLEFILKGNYAEVMGSETGWRCDLSSPGVKGDSVHEGTVVVVPHVIPHHSPACA